MYAFWELFPLKDSFGSSCTFRFFNNQWKLFITLKRAGNANHCRQMYSSSSARAGVRNKNKRRSSKRRCWYFEYSDCPDAYSNDLVSAKACISISFISLFSHHHKNIQGQTTLTYTTEFNIRAPSSLTRSFTELLSPLL